MISFPIGINNNNKCTYLRQISRDYKIKLMMELVTNSDKQLGAAIVNELL